MDAYFYEFSIHIWGMKIILTLGNIFHENEGTLVWENTLNYFSNKKFNYLNFENNLY